VFGERNVALELEADEELSVKPKLMTKWAEQLKVRNNRTMTFVDKGLMNCSSIPLYVSLSRNTARALQAFEYEMNLNDVYKSYCKSKFRFV
jgi:hypothetical protein